MKKISNDQNIKNLKSRKILRYLIIVCGLITIVLAVLSLTIKLSFIYSLIAFIIMTILTKKRESIPIKLNKSKDIKIIEREMNKQKNSKKK